MRDRLNDLLPSRAVARRLYELENELKQARAYQRRYSKSPETISRWGLEQPAVQQQEEGWFITYLDMMTLLLVVMIVMLAFAGSLSGNAQTDESIDLGAITLASVEETIAPPPVDGEEEDAAALASPPVEADPTPAGDAPAPAGGTGLLPGGPGLFPGQSALADAAAVSEPLPGWTATWDIPSPLAHPADIGPLPRDAQPIAKAASQLPPARSAQALYPGWSAADLAASFIGPRRPAKAPESTQPAAALAANAESTPPVPDDDTPSEGESLAAGLSLGDLGNDVEVVIHERSVSFRINSEILFDSSQADLSLSGLAVLRRIVGVLSETNHEVTVEGHTDAVPVRRNARYPSNWELSSARAGSVVRYLQANGIHRSRLKAVGYADTRPIADNHTPAGRAANRRVELMLEKRD